MTQASYPDSRPFLPTCEPLGRPRGEMICRSQARTGQRSQPLTVVLLLLLLASLAQTTVAEVTRLPIGDPERKEKEVTARLDAITDTRSGELLSPAQLAQRLAGADMLLLGEGHTDIDTHRVQLQVLQALRRAGRKVLIGLEMFPLSQQSHLDRWTAGELGEEDFLREVEWYRYWGYHWGYYRDIFLYAREHHLAMFGVNVPRAVVRAVRRKGFDGLEEEQRQLLPPRIDVDNEEHRQLFRAFFDEDDELHGMLDEEAWNGMFRSQCTWDAAMGWHSLRALQGDGGEETILVLLVGSGHVAYGLGIQRQVGLHHDGRVVSLIPVEMDGDEEPMVQASYADFVWGIPEQEHPLYPSLGVSLSGSIGPEPTMVIQVGEDSPGEAAELQVGDVLLALDTVAIGSGSELNEAMSVYRWGDVATVRVRREGEEMDLQVAFRRSVPATDATEAAEEDEHSQLPSSEAPAHEAPQTDAAVEDTSAGSEGNPASVADQRM